MSRKPEVEPRPSDRAGASEPPHQDVPTFHLDWIKCGDDEPFITGAAIMQLAGIARSPGLALCHSDGTQEVITEDQRVKLVLRLRRSHKGATRHAAVVVDGHARI